MVDYTPDLHALLWLLAMAVPCLIAAFFIGTLFERRRSKKSRAEQEPKPLPKPAPFGPEATY